MTNHDTPDDWTPEQNAMFSRMFRHMLEAQPMFTHPDAPRVADEHWETTCWNAAWFAVACGEDAGTWVHLDSESGDVLAVETPRESFQ